MRCALSLAPTEALPYPTISCACALAGPLLPCLVVAVQRYVVVLCMCCAERLTATKRCRGAAQTPTSSCTSTRARSTQRSSSSTRIRAAVRLGWRWRTQTCCSRGRPRERAQRTRGSGAFGSGQQGSRSQVAPAQYHERVRVARSSRRIECVGGTVSRCKHARRECMWWRKKRIESTF